MVFETLSNSEGWLIRHSEAKPPPTLHRVGRSLGNSITGCGCTLQYLCCIFSVAKLYCGLVQPIGLSRLSVFKEVHLTISSFLEAVFEVVDRWYDLLRKELQSSITVAMIRHQFPTVTSSNLVFGSVKEDWPRSCSNTIHHFKNFK